MTDNKFEEELKQLTTQLFNLIQQRVDENGTEEFAAPISSGATGTILIADVSVALTQHKNTDVHTPFTDAVISYSVGSANNGSRRIDGDGFGKLGGNKTTFDWWNKQ